MQPLCRGLRLILGGKRPHPYLKPARISRVPLGKTRFPHPFQPLQHPFGRWVFRVIAHQNAVFLSLCRGLRNGYFRFLLAGFLQGSNAGAGLRFSGGSCRQSLRSRLLRCRSCRGWGCAGLRGNCGALALLRPNRMIKPPQHHCQNNYSQNHQATCQVPVHRPSPRVIFLPYSLILLYTYLLSNHNCFTCEKVQLCIRSWQTLSRSAPWAWIRRSASIFKAARLADEASSISSLAVSRVT
jgi:hypothetical protein